MKESYLGTCKKVTSEIGKTQLYREEKQLAIHASAIY